MAENVFDEMEADAQGMHVDDQQLKAVADMAQKLEHVRKEEEQKQAELKEIQERERQLSQVDIPEKLEEIGMEEFTLSDGSKVSVKDEVKLSIPKAPEKRQSAFRFLRDAGLGSLIKEKVEVSENAEQAEEVLKQAGVDYKVNEDAHTGAVKSALKELEAEGQDVPWSDLGGYKYKQTKVEHK